MLLMTDIHVRSFSGSGIRPYIHSLAKLRCEILKDYPYFEEPDLNYHTQLLKRVSTHKEALAVLIFDTTTLVGASLGYPLNCAEEFLQHPFKEKNLPVDAYYFFGESMLLKAYRGRGIGHHFFDAREAYVLSHSHFKHICFAVPAQIESNQGRPSDFIPLHDFWRKRGYIHHPELKTSIVRKKTEGAPSQENLITFWTKDL